MQTILRLMLFYNHLCLFLFLLGNAMPLLLCPRSALWQRRRGTGVAVWSVILCSRQAL